jgi:trigger factor
MDGEREPVDRSSGEMAEWPGDEPGGETTVLRGSGAGHDPDAIVARPMATAVTASVTELPESRVRVEAEVSAEEVERRLEQTAKALGKQLKIPGFRKGKVPPPVVVKRMGRPAVLDEAVRGSLGAWYTDAIHAAGIAPVGDPSLDLGDLPAEGEPLTFSIEIGVRPKAALGDYKGLEVGRREPEVPEEAIDSQLEQLREGLAKLDTVEESAAKGDFVVVDFTGTFDGEPMEGGEARDELVEVGAARVMQELDEALEGMSAGETKTVDSPFPDDHPSEDLRGKTAQFEISVKEVKRKQLPELDDDLAADSAGFDTLAELRDDIAAKLREREEETIETEFREAALDAAVANAKLDVPDPLIDARARELWEQLAHSLSHQGISKEAYLRISGKPEEEIIGEARPDAERNLRREAVLAAVIDAESIEPSDEDVLEAIGPTAERENVTPEALLDRLRDTGRLDTLRRDVASRQALDLLAESAKAIPAEQAEAREKLWTPDSDDAGEEGAEAGGKLWTPGS